jgi:hydroxyethylthiazole kinase-like uncharacterized protein yjeF
MIPVALPRAIYSTEQVRAFDRHAIEQLGIAGFELMQRAGGAALEFLRDHWPNAGSLLIYCGAGNNAGDGYVLAALAARRGLNARVVAATAPDGLRGDAAAALGLAREAGVEIIDFESGSAARADVRAASADLLVDGLLGTGLARDVEGRLAAAVAEINARAEAVLALDIPTGLDSDSGVVRGIAVEADATITFVGLKAGLYLGSGPACRGRLAFSDLGLPAEVFARTAPRLRRIDESDRAHLLRPRSRIAHKGLNGRVLIVGGAAGMSGAARLAAEAALRAGAGLVHAAVAPASVGAVMAGRPEIMCRAVTDAEDFADWAAAADVVVVGPGLGRSDWSERLAAAVFALDKPLVVDADALNILSGRGVRRACWVLTPHPGEAARLLGCSAAEVQAARDEAARRLAREFGAVAVLKGACSLVAQVTEKESVSVAVCDYGNPGMATAGTGDVLSGVTGGLIAQFGLSAQTVETAVLVHALAGDDAARDGGERGLVASDLFAPIRRRVNPI